MPAYSVRKHLTPAELEVYSDAVRSERELKDRLRTIRKRISTLRDRARKRADAELPA